MYSPTLTINSSIHSTNSVPMCGHSHRVDNSLDTVAKKYINVTRIITSVSFILVGLGVYCTLKRGIIKKG